MKKVLLSVIMLTTTSIFAQEFGVKAGSNISNFRGKDFPDNTKSYVGYYAGLFIDIEIAENLNIQPEVLYSNVGAKIDQGFMDKSKIDYISVPVSLQYEVLDDLRIELIPQIDFMMSSKIKLNRPDFNPGVPDPNDPVFVSSDEDFKDFTNKLNYGLGIGVNYEIFEGLGVNARYSMSLNETFNQNLYLVGKNDSKYKNNVFHIGIFYKF